MEKLCLALVILGSVLAMAMSRPEPAWVENLCQGKEKVVKIRVYIQDVASGPNATVWPVARANITTAGPPFFGQVLVMDELVTAGPDPGSERLGRAQGIVAFADFNVPALSVYINFYFTAGEYNGSTLTILGRNDITTTSHDYPVVGGSGVFRMARGYSISNSTVPGLAEHNIVVSYIDPQSL